MGLRASGSASAGTRLQGLIKLARLLEAPESELADSIRRAEDSPLFKGLVAARVVRVEPFPGAGFASRRFGGWGLRTATDGLAEALDGRDELFELIRTIGQEAFEESFLRGDELSDAERARRCGISAAEAARLRAFVDRLYVQEELQGAAPAAPAATYSAVAGVELDGGRPVLGFFHRDVWKGRYAVDEERLSAFSGALLPAEARRLSVLLKRLELMDRRKTTLFKVLQAVLEEQAAYLAGGDPAARRPFSQKELARRVDSSPSVINRLVSNKSIQLPWGVEAPLKALLPSRKTLLKDRLFELAAERPDLSDEGLRVALAERHGVVLSRRSIAQYRAELRLAGRGRRSSPKSGRARL